MFSSVAAIARRRRNGGESSRTLVVDAYYESHGEYPDPMDVLTTLEATAREDVHDSYTAESVGAGYVDALAAVERAEAGDLAGFDGIEVAR